MLVQLENSSPEVQQFTAHEIEEENAEGAVLRARQGFTVHVLSEDLAKDAAYRKLFIRHASTAVRFHHEGAVSVRDVLVEAECLALVTTEPEGRSLQDVIPPQGMPLYQVVEVLESVAEALDLYHQNGLVHGNIGMDSIRVRQDGQGVLSGLGIYRQGQWFAERDPNLYDAPEQFGMRKESSAEADRYAFALITFYALTGKFPWKKDTEEKEIEELKAQKRLLPLSTLLTEVDVELVAGMVKMLSPDPKHRLSFCIELIDLIQGAVLSRPRPAEIPEVDAVLLEKTKSEILLIDHQLMRLNNQILRKKQQLVDAEQRRQEMLQHALHKFEAFLQKKQELREEFQEKKPTQSNSKGGFWRLFSGLFRGEKNDSSKVEETESIEHELEELEKQHQREEEQRQIQYSDEEEAAHQLFMRTEKSINEDIEPLQLSKQELEFRLQELGRVHPRLLGFRAKNPFSRAEIQVADARLEMILIPRGHYMRGSAAKDASEDEQPRHRVVLKRSFWIGTVPLTQELYYAMMGVNPSRFDNPKAPVETVSWYDALHFCNALSLREKLNPAYVIMPSEEEDVEFSVRWVQNANGYRLPTEAEWEYVAKCNQNRLFSGSDKLDEVAWYAENSNERTHSVGGKQANDWGLHDLSGNVWEWCWDWQGAYPEGTVRNPSGPLEGVGRVYRGGSWAGTERLLRNSNRGKDLPGNRFHGVGFRLVKWSL